MSEPSEQSPAASTPVCTGLSGEWEARTLCPDDSCLGVLGSDGRCRLCGLRGDLSVPPGQVQRPSAPAALAAAAEESEQAAPVEPSADRGGDNDDFEARALCERDDCIGVLGPDGACKVCGWRAAAGPA